MSTPQPRPLTLRGFSLRLLIIVVAAFLVSLLFDWIFPRAGQTFAQSVGDWQRHLVRALLWGLVYIATYAELEFKARRQPTYGERTDGYRAGHDD